jgi:hypothetical protein
MNVEDQIEFHSARAQAELDMAGRAQSIHAANAHFNLSALHLEKARGLGARTHGPAIPLFRSH